MAVHCVLEEPWTEEPGGLQPVGHVTEHTLMRGVEEEGLVAINRDRTKKKKKKRLYAV